MTPGSDGKKEPNESLIFLAVKIYKLVVGWYTLGRKIKKSSSQKTREINFTKTFLVLMTTYKKS